MDRLKRYRFVLRKHGYLLAIWVLCATAMPAITTGVLNNTAPWFSQNYEFSARFEEAVGILCMPLLILGLILVMPEIGPKTGRSKVLFLAITLWTGLWVGHFWADEIRAVACKKIEARGKLLVAAITEYQKRNGRSPEDLEELVPQYISAVPDTGVPGFPSFNYDPGHLNVYSHSPSEQACLEKDWLVEVSRCFDHHQETLYFYPEHDRRFIRAGTTPHRNNWVFNRS